MCIAGVNAARRAQDLATVVIPRDSSYLGTLVDDLVTKVASTNCLALHGRRSAAVSDGSAAAYMSGILTIPGSTAEPK